MIIAACRTDEQSLFACCVAVLCATSTSGYSASYAVLPENNWVNRATGNCATWRIRPRSVPHQSARGTWQVPETPRQSIAHRLRFVEHMGLPSLSPDGNFPQQSAGNLTFSSGGVGGRVCEVFSYPDRDTHHHANRRFRNGRLP